MRFKGNFGILSITIEGTSLRGTYQKNGQIFGDFSDNIFKGIWNNKGLDGLLEFKIDRNKLVGHWKYGSDPGPMKGKWQGELLPDSDDIQYTTHRIISDEVLKILNEEENPDEILINLYQFEKKQKFSDLELINFFFEILAYKPNGTLAGDFALRLFKLGFKDESLKIILDEKFCVGDDLDFSYYSSHKKFILEQSLNCLLLDPSKNYNSNDFKLHLKNNPRFISPNEEKITLQVKIFGRLHQINLGQNDDESVDIENLQDSDLNYLQTVYKIDADNIIQIELNGIRIYESTLEEMGLGPNDLYSFNECTQFHKTLFILRKKSLFSEQICTNLSEINDEFDDFIGVYLTQSNLILIEGSLDKLAMKNAPSAFRKSYTHYGKFILQTRPIMIRDFRISDLILIKDYNMDDFESSSESAPYCISEIYHCEHGQLELEVDYFNIKDSWPRQYWIGDF